MIAIARQQKVISNDENRQVNGFLWLYMMILLPGNITNERV